MGITISTEALPCSPVTVITIMTMVQRGQFIVTVWPGERMKWKLMLGTEPTIFSSSQCMTTCTKGVMFEMFKELPCVDVWRRCLRCRDLIVLKLTQKSSGYLHGIALTRFTPLNSKKLN